MKEQKISIIGGGNLGTSLAKGLILSKQFTYDDLLISEKSQDRLAALKEMGFKVTSDNHEAIRWANTIVMSVKPQQFNALAGELKSSIDCRKLFISTITSVTNEEIEKQLGEHAIARIIPNTALEILESMTCISFNRLTTDKQKAELKDMFDKMGATIVINEDLMGAATVVGACGTAFALRFIRAMAQGGIEIGFNSEVSHFITAQTVKGAAKLLLETGNHPEYEIDKVTTPQGITISGLNEMAYQGFSSAVIKGIVTSYSKLESVRKQ
ncbi:MAG: pyrroline-5-carboxylate reductase [Bacteroidales bacterium]|nr:pyrroline-5-carboxylate reductase [Bacteroidales bacterium]